MRRLVLAASAAAMLGIPQALAAPTCQTIRGETIRCGTEGAMPVGWTLSADKRLARPASPNVTEILEVLCALGVFFALLSLLPDFEGDWDDEDRS